MVISCTLFLLYKTMRQISCVFLHDFGCMTMMIKINKMRDEMKCGKNVNK